jgi:hypothetical protein
MDSVSGSNIIVLLLNDFPMAAGASIASHNQRFSPTVTTQSDFMTTIWLIDTNPLTGVVTKT